MNRSPELDGMRTIAILLMATSHFTRTVKSTARSFWGEPALLLDPYIQALFMGLVGASLAWSWHGAQARGMGRGPWMRARGRRALQVYGIGVALFFFDKGLQLPWVFISPGILADIALGIVVYGTLASSRRPIAWTLGLTGLGYAALFLLERQGLSLPVLNGGNAPLLPNTLSIGVGLLFGIGLLRGDRRILLPLAGLALGAGALVLARHGLVALLDGPLGRTEDSLVFQGTAFGLANTWGILTGAELEPHPVVYFNPTLLGQPLVLGMVVATWGLLRLLRPLLAPVSRGLFLPGRYSLGIYVFHLVVVGLPVLIMGRSKPWRTEPTAWVGLIGLLLCCYAYAAFRQWQVRRAGRVAPSAD